MRTARGKEIDMVTPSTTPSTTTAAAAETEGTAPSPTVTHYQQLAEQFMGALDEIASLIPKLEAAHITTAGFVKTHQNIPNQFLATVISAVEQTPELQSVRKLDVLAARDTLQVIEAFRPVLDKVVAFGKNLQFTLKSRKATLVLDSLQIYDIAKGVARDANSATVASLVDNMQRDLGRRGRTTIPLVIRRAKAAGKAAAKAAAKAAVKADAAALAAKVWRDAASGGDAG
jgi:hypothetical protein